MSSPMLLLSSSLLLFLTTPCSLHWFCILFHFTLLFFGLLLVETCKLQSSFSLITVADTFNGRQLSLLLLSFSSVLISYECFWPTCWYSLLGTRHIHNAYIQLFLLVFWTNVAKEKSFNLFNSSDLSRFLQSILMMRIVSGSTSGCSASLAVTIWLKA